MVKDEYYVVFDTNILYSSYNKGDFTTFALNSAFEDVVNFVEQLDMYSYVTILIPDAVYEELKTQKIKAHNNKKKSLLDSIEASTIPGFSHKMEEIDYETYIADKINEYRNKLAAGQVVIGNLPLPTEKRFNNIINRAFAKKPPFLGQDKESDKGFKDALIWESILEYKENIPQSKFIFYCRDKGFEGALEGEFQKIFDDQIFICKDQKEVESQLKIWAKSIDEYVYIPEKPLEEEFDSIIESPIAAQLEKKAEELAVLGSTSSVEDIEEKFASATGKVANEDDV